METPPPSDGDDAAEPARPEIDPGLLRSLNAPPAEAPSGSDPASGAPAEATEASTQASRAESTEASADREDGGPSPGSDAAADSPDPASIPVDAQDAEVADAAEVAESKADGVDEAEEGGDEILDAFEGVPLTTRVEALLFAAPEALSLNRLKSLLGVEDGAEVRDALATLAKQYEATGRAFRVLEVAGGFQMRTRQDLAPLVGRLRRKRAPDDKLSPAALETLAIVAYRQPVLRADVEKIRGVACGEVLRSLMERGLVRVAGRAELPGSPLLYGTTPHFLEVFGLRNLRDLPKKT